MVVGVVVGVVCGGARGGGGGGGGGGGILYLTRLLALTSVSLNILFSINLSWPQCIDIL